MKSAVILVVDDDPKIRNLLRRTFEGEGSTVHEAGNKAEVLGALSKHGFDLVTLDLDLGEDDGLDVATAVRKISSVPIIMVTAKDDVIDRVVGLEIGADDYITKPFHLREVLARVKSVLRRTGVAHQSAGLAPASPCVEFDGMKAIPAEMLLYDRNCVRVDMTSGEFKLLNVFLERPKRVLSREQLMDLIGGYSYTPMDRTIDNQIARLRKKIERNATSPRLISTIRGVGYSFTCDVRECKDEPPSNRAERAAARSD
ncbi:DNA-binding response OmpR family regulator [Yoonia maricola]|uniref:DNA-binding response OmpR family regulator n=1 Tax=Yoonia maricola TaxID=420999 RepID=A0A2M8WMC7_9RHOB|nr:response regulator transcription factor [Yoonia maricola]PJI92084.1 DNA-binding response OmpR family regulator [Yoonia maricola]